MTKAESPPTVHVVDDELAVLNSLVRLLSAAKYQVRGYSSAEEFLDQHDSTSIGCIILDVALPGLTGPELQRKLLDIDDTQPIVFLTGRGDIETGVNAMKAGAFDFLTKPADADTLLATLSSALLHARLQRQRRQYTDSIRRRIESLSRREREVFSHIVCGRLNKQVAGDLGVVEKTIKVHRARVMKKMGAQSLVHLVRMAGFFEANATQLPKTPDDIRDALQRVDLGLRVRRPRVSGLGEER